MSNERMEEVRSHRDLQVWQLSMDLAEMVYQLTSQFPKQEDYRLTSQMIRAAISIPSNIAEGNARGTRRDYANFVSIARGSAAELETQLILVQRNGLATKEQVAPLLELIERVGRMLTKLRQSLNSSSNPKSPFPNPEHKTRVSN